MTKTNRPRILEITPRWAFILWRICRSLASHNSSIPLVFESEFPGSTRADLEYAVSLGEALGLFRESKSPELTDLGLEVSRLDSVRNWRIQGNAKVGTSAVENLYLSPTARPKIVDLFSGAGGLGLGFEMAGFEVVAAVENDPQAAAAHRNNFPNAIVFEEDIVPLSKTISSRLESAGVSPATIDGVIGGPPCQGFSFMGERSTNDERNLLTSRFVDVVENLSPRFFVMENVPGLFSSGKAPDLLTFLIRQSKLTGEAASNIVEALPPVSSAVAKRSRQFIRRLVSASLDELSLWVKEQPVGTEFDVDSFRKLHTLTFGNLIGLLSKRAEDYYPNLLEVEDALSKLQSEISIISGGVCLEAYAEVGLISEKDVREKLTSVTKANGRVNVALSELLSKYDAIPEGSIFKGTKLGPIAANLVTRLSKNYRVAQPVVLNSAEFGAPQDRRRAFIVGIRKDLGTDFEIPVPKYRSTRSTSATNLPLGWSSSDVLSDLPDIDLFEELLAGDKISAANYLPAKSALASELRLDLLNSADLSLPRPTWNPFQIDCCKRTIHTEEAKLRIAETPLGKQEGTSGRTRLHPDLSSHTLRAGTREGKGSHTAVRPLHYDHARVISVREGARLMGFPDWMSFHETKWHGFRLVGNGVPAQLGQAVADSIMQVLRHRG